MDELESKLDYSCKPQTEKQKQTCVLQAVILAGGEGETMRPLKHKAMAPVANRPLIWYTIQNVLQNKIEDILIITNKDLVDPMRHLIKSEFEVTDDSVSNPHHNATFDIQCVEVDIQRVEDDESQETVDVLSLVSTSLRDCFVVLTCDFVGYIDFSPILERHLAQKAICTVVLKRPLKSDDTLKKSKKKSSDELYIETPNCVYVCMNEEEESLLCIKTDYEIYVGSSFELSQLQLYWNPNVLLETNLSDLHIYFFDKSVLKVLKNKNLQLPSIRHDLVPFLAAMQNTPDAFKWTNDSIAENLIPQLSALEVSEGKVDTEHSKGFTYSDPPNKPSEGSKVLYSIHTPGDRICGRVNSMEALRFFNERLCTTNPTELNAIAPSWMQPPQTPKMSGVMDSLVDSSVTLPPKCTIRKSVIGKETVVEDGVQIVSSVIMDGCIIRAGARLSGCIICSKVDVGTKCKLERCSIEEDYKLPEHTKASDTILPSDPYL